MALETGTYISDLVSTNPAASDNISQGDDHIRLLKATIKATFPNVSGAVTPTHTELSKLGSTGTPTFGGLALESTDSGASAGPTLDLYRGSASPAPNDLIGQIGFSGKDSGGNYTGYGAIVGNIIDPTNGSEDGSLAFWTLRAGVMTEAVRIDNTGYVGVATTAPEYPLDVKAADNVTTTTAIAVQNSSRNYGLGLGAYQLTNRNIGGTATTVDFTFDIGGASIFNTSGTERMRIASGGNVGIGDNNPSQKLSVNGSLGLAYNNSIVFGAGTCLDAVKNYWDGASDTLQLQPAGSSNGIITFNTSPTAAATRTERMRIDSNGYVAINTLPQSYAQLRTKNDRASTTYSYVADTHNGATFENSYVRGFDGSRTFLGNYQNFPIDFLVNNDPKVRITTAGYVGIGTTSPSYPLTVNGDIRTLGAGNIYATGSGLIGYGSGAGGTVTQTGARTTAVTLNKSTGRITLVSAAATTSWTTFTVNNSLVALTDTILLVQRSGALKYNHFVSNVAAGSFDISFAATSGTTTEQPSIQFSIVSGTTS